jgi:hypothetical protein
MTNEELIEKVMWLEVKVNHLIDVINTLNQKELIYGNKRNWSEEQHEFLLSKYNETTDLDQLTVAVNTEFGPRGYIERSPTAIACQLYKLVPIDVLPKKIKTIAEKYVK